LAFYFHIETTGVTELVRHYLKHFSWFTIFMWYIPVCFEYKTGTINRQSHTE